MINTKEKLAADKFMEFIQLLIFSKGTWDDEAEHKGFQAVRAEAVSDPNPQPVHGLVGQAVACIEHDVVEQLGQIACPSLVIGGEADMFTPQWMAKEVAAGIPDSQLHLYEGAGHAFHWERIDDFNPRVADWLRQH